MIRAGKLLTNIPRSVHVVTRGKLGSCTPPRVRISFTVSLYSAYIWMYLLRRRRLSARDTVRNFEQVYILVAHSGHVVHDEYHLCKHSYAHFIVMQVNFCTKTRFEWKQGVGNDEISWPWRFQVYLSTVNITLVQVFFSPDLQLPRSNFVSIDFSRTLRIFYVSFELIHGCESMSFSISVIIVDVYAALFFFSTQNYEVWVWSPVLARGREGMGKIEGETA